MAILKDSFGNEIRNLDTIGGEVLIDTRTTVRNIAALNGEVILDCANTKAVALDVRGTFVSTLVVEATINGNDYFSVPFFVSTSEIWATTITANGIWICHLPSGCKRVRVRASAYTSGTALVSLRSSAGDNLSYAKPLPTTASVTTTAASGAALTLSVPTPGIGLFHYITKIVINKYCAATLTAGAAPIIVNTTNIATTPSIDFKTLGSIGDSERIELDFTGNPLKSTTANTATTIVCPVVAGVLWKVSVFYYVGA